AATTGRSPARPRARRTDGHRLLRVDATCTGVGRGPGRCDPGRSRFIHAGTRPRGGATRAPAALLLPGGLPVVRSAARPAAAPRPRRARAPRPAARGIADGRRPADPGAGAGALARAH